MTTRGAGGEDCYLARPLPGYFDGLLSLPPRLAFGRRLARASCEKEQKEMRRDVRELRGYPLSRGNQSGPSDAPCRD